METKNKIVSIVGGVLFNTSSLFFSGCEVVGGYSEPCPVYAMPPYPAIIYEREYPPPVFYFPSPPPKDIVIIPPRHHLRSYPSHPFNNGPYGRPHKEYHPRR